MTVRMTATRATRVGAVLAVAAAAIAGTASSSSAAAVAIIASPATGSASTVITLNTTTANTFKSATGVLRVANTAGTIAANAVQFATAACPTVAPTGTARTVTDGATTSGSSTITSATGAFTTADWGKLVTGTGIPANTTIVAIVSSTSVKLSANATATGASVSLTFSPYLVPSARQVTDGVTVNASASLTSASAAFTTADLGKAVTGTGIPANTYITTITSATAVVLSQSATASASSVTVTVSPQVASQVTVVTGTKLVIKPAALSPANAYNVCVYDAGVGTAVTTLATSKFQVFAAPTIAAISASSGPAVGGNTLTVDGTGFSAKTTATLGGVAMTGLKVVNSTQFTATVPAHAPSATAQDLVVTTEGGPVTSATAYTFLDGITVAPQNVVTGQAAVLDIIGAGFSSLTFNPAGAPGDANAHVWIKKGGQGATWTTGADDGECTTVTVISDGELICTLDTMNAGGTAGAVAVADASYQVLIVDNDGTPTRLTKVTSGSSLTVAPF
jgi:hypothetical protein